MRILCVAEKPSIAKAVANALGGGAVTTRKSSAKYINNYDLSFNFAGWGPCTVTVTAVLGHVTDLEFVAPFNDWKSPALSLFNAPVKVFVPGDKTRVAANIKKECRGADILYIWTDCDREGEHIGAEIVNIAREVKKTITVKRAKFSNTDPAHLRQAAGRPGELDWRQVAAVNVRRELDLRTGFALTRFQTGLYKKRFSELRERGVISYGACQFPTLGFVVDRYNRVKNHVPEPFWYIDLKVHKGTEKVGFNWDRVRLFDYMMSAVLYERACTAGGSTARVTSVESKPTTQYKPLPLTTVKLQKLGVTYLKMSSKTIMDIAEGLYNKGFISYPRTETDQYDDNIDVRTLVSRLEHQRDWGAYATKLLNGQFSSPRRGKNNDKAHPPIHPIKGADRSALKPEEFRVYEFVCRHFLATCSQDAQGTQSTVRIAYGEEPFHKTGVIVRSLNYLEIYTYAKWSSTPIPDFALGEELQVSSVMLKDGKTTPPSFITEPELIALMDANGIGTDATMADHIQKIKQREFIATVKNALVPTTLGVALVAGYDSIGLDSSLTKPQLRRETESEVSHIAAGSLQEGAVLSNMISQYERMFRLANDNKEKLLEIAAEKLEGP